MIIIITGYGFTVFFLLCAKVFRIRSGRNIHAKLNLNPLSVWELTVVISLSLSPDWFLLNWWWIGRRCSWQASQRMMTPVSPLTPLTPWPSQWPAVQVLISRETIISSWMKPTSTSTRCGIVLSCTSTCSLCFTVECISLYYLVHCTCNSTITPCTPAVAEMYVLYHHCTECCPCLVPS